MSNLRVLLVEDNEMNRALVRAILARTSEPRLRGTELVEAGDVASAQAALAGGEYDLILLDVHLPDGSGLTIAQEVSARPAGRPPIVALTAAALAREQAAALEAGCDTFLAKPYTSSELVATILKLLPE
jgi:two-component system, OmpR family, KDP operon response regulator KdpE